MAVQPGYDLTPAGLTGSVDANVYVDSPWAASPVYGSVAPGSVFVMRGKLRSDGTTVYWYAPYPDLNAETLPHTGSVDNVVVSTVTFWQSWTG
jgi:hypothetical protein